MLEVRVFELLYICDIEVRAQIWDILLVLALSGIYNNVCLADGLLEYWRFLGL